MSSIGHHDVVIIGAGISGLRVADLVIAAGLDVTVLESRDRVGGRLHSVETGNGMVDLGATWFWSGERHVEQLISELGIETHPQYLDGDAVYHDPPAVQRLNGNQIDVPSGRFTRSAGDLAAQLAHRLPDGTVQLERPATGVRSDAGQLTVQTPDGDLHANHVVLALPPSLAIHALSFEPPLPEPLDGLARATPVWMGAIAKVVAVYPTAFWRSAGLAGAAMSHVGPLREIHDMSGADGTPAALFGFAPILAVGDPAPDRDAVLQQLMELFGPEAGEPSELHIMDWRAEAATSPPGVESVRTYQTYGHPLWSGAAMDGRLHWSSTETSPVSPGHIDGALFGARRTATTIIDSSTKRNES